MSGVRLLVEGTDVTYEDLLEMLRPGETLVAAWQVPGAESPANRRVVAGKGIFALIRGKAASGVYRELSFFASGEE